MVPGNVLARSILIVASAAGRAEEKKIATLAAAKAPTTEIAVDCKGTLPFRFFLEKRCLFSGSDQCGR
jgi:hypothetical protein